MLSIASEVLQSSEKGTASSGGSSKSSSEEGKTSASATASSPESSESTAAAEASRDESSLAGEGEASSEESSSGDGTSETAAGESVSSSDESPAAAGSKDAAKPAVQDAARASDFFNAENSKNLLTDVRVIEGEVYTIDGANEISLLDPGESLRVNFKAHSSSDLQPLSVVKADPPSLMAVEADPVRPMVKDDAGAAVVRDDVSAMTVDLPASTVREEPSVPVVKPSSVETIVPPAPKDVVESALPPSVTELEKSGTRYGTLKDPGKDVFVKCRGGEWQAAKDGMVILPGDQVRTSANSSVEVLLDGNKTAQVEVKEGSLFRINKAETDPVTGDKTTLLDLAMGKVLVHVEKLEGRSKFEVKTPTALTGVRGTTFEVTVKEKL
jgi:hypothetical protein